MSSSSDTAAAEHSMATAIPTLATTAKKITAVEFQQMEFDKPVELVHGVIVEMTSPGYLHGVICGNVYFLLRSWNETDQSFVLAANDSGIVTSADSVRGADISLIRKSRLPQAKVPVGHLTVPPELAVEVLSQHDRWNQVLEKVADYLEAGVLEVWVLEPEVRALHRFTSENSPMRFQENDLLTSEDVLPGFSVIIAQFFEGT